MESARAQLESYRAKAQRVLAEKEAVIAALKGEGGGGGGEEDAELQQAW